MITIMNLGGGEKEEKHPRRSCQGEERGRGKEEGEEEEEFIQEDGKRYDGKRIRRIRHVVDRREKLHGSKARGGDWAADEDVASLVVVEEEEMS